MRELDRRTIASIWLGGILLMLVLYVVGPQHFIQMCEALFSRFLSFIGDIIDVLMERAFDAVRAAAIALYVVFVVLALLAGQRRLRSGAALFIVSVLYFLLVGTRWYDPATKWFSAAVLAGIGAAVMTGRLMRPPPTRRDPRDPWGAAGTRGGPGPPPLS